MSDRTPHQERLRRPPDPIIQELYGRPHITADLAHLPVHLACHRAHVVMLAERHIITDVDAAKLLREFDAIERGGPGVIPVRPEFNDLFTCLEAHLISSLGEDVAGRLHSGRSRNDLFMAIARITTRNAVLRLVEAILELQAALLVRADEHASTLFPGYTHHSQQAQPTTFGHFLLAHVSALARDVDRLREGYARVNRSPLGGAALVGTRFPIDRTRLAALLAFDGLVENTMDAAGARDFEIEVLSAAAIFGSNAGRLAESLILYSSVEFALINLDDAFASVSSIMPQKKNPVSLELVEAFGARSIGHLTTVLALIKSSTLGMSRELGLCDAEVLAALEDETGAAMIMAAAVATMQVDAGRARALVDSGYSTATDIAEELVRREGLPFRLAHRIVGRAVAMATEVGRPIDRDGLQRASADIGGPSIDLDAGQLREVLDAARSVESRLTVGGPGKPEVARMVKERRDELASARAWLDSKRAATDAGASELRASVDLLMSAEGA